MSILIYAIKISSMLILQACYILCGADKMLGLNHVVSWCLLNLSLFCELISMFSKIMVVFGSCLLSKEFGFFFPHILLSICILSVGHENNIGQVLNINANDTLMTICFLWSALYVLKFFNLYSILKGKIFYAYICLINPNTLLNWNKSFSLLE